MRVLPSMAAAASLGPTLVAVPIVAARRGTASSDGGGWGGDDAGGGGEGGEGGGFDSDGGGGGGDGCGGGDGDGTSLTGWLGGLLGGLAKCDGMVLNGESSGALDGVGGSDSLCGCDGRCDDGRCNVVVICGGAVDAHDCDLSRSMATEAATVVDVASTARSTQVLHARRWKGTCSS